MDKRKLKFRNTAIAALCAVTITCTGLAAACSPTEQEKPSSPPQNQREDNQLLKNGDFEYSVVPEKAVHLIKTVNNWSLNAGERSGVMSGVIDTSKTAWDKLDSPDLKEKLDYNNDLSSSDPDYKDLHVDYNGMSSEDILYADAYAAGFENDSDVVDTDDVIAIHGSYKNFMGVEGDAESGYTYNGKTVYASDDEAIKEFYYDEDFTKPLRYTRISNPETHLGAYSEKDGKYYLGETEILVDEDGSYWIDSNGDGKLDRQKDASTGNVLMVHNYPANRKYNGIEQHYTSQTITLEANTAAEISVWVKTTGLKFDKGFSQLGDQDRGAYIEVNQTVASTTIDSFKIRAINTEKILGDKDLNLPDGVSGNGWLKYTVYVNACDFASSTISINLGLGDGNSTQKVTGYAFFDDVEVKKFIDLNDEDCSYKGNAESITEASSSCTLTSEKDEKIFIADKEVRNGENDKRCAEQFHYLIDLSSESAGESEKTSVLLHNENLKATVALTDEKSGGKLYASALENEAKLEGGITKNDKTYVLPDSMVQTGGRPTFNDLIGIYDSTLTAFTKDNFNTDKEGLRDLSSRLNSALTGENGLSALTGVSKDGKVGDMLVMLSAYGAAYTATFENSDSSSEKAFIVKGNQNDDSENYKIISFWIKTSDLSGGTAATLKLVDVNDEDNVATFSIDTTNRTTDIGENKDIYHGWSQCFFFVSNDTKEDKEFKLEFGFGNQTIVDTALTSYVPGWAAVANMQSIDVNKDVFKLVSDGDFAKTLSFKEEDEKKGNSLDEANGMSNVKKGVAVPSNYYGVNGGSSFVTDKLFGDDYDSKNNNKDGISGLINRDGFKDYDEEIRSSILKAFGKDSYTDAVEAWNEVFGEDCYQPLIIVDSVRSYRDRAKANADNFKDYYIIDEQGNYVLVSSLPEEEQVFDENETYYSEEQLVKNYGFIGASSSVSADSCQTISVKVKVTGNAVAYVYLVNPETREVLKYGTPEYTFYYDEEGNVLKEEYDDSWTDEEHRNAILYDLRDDGLYEDKDGKLFANLYNLTKRFKYAKYESNTFYKKEGDNYELVKYDDLKDGEEYYINDNGNYKLASHYLVVDVQRVYEYDADTQKYYYVTGGERGAEVNNFDPQYARYSYAGVEALPEYSVEINDTEGKWVTVNFIIKTGKNAKDYRLELWSGKRGETGVTEDASDEGNGAIAFDVSSYSVTSSNYSTVLLQYENAIKDVYTQLILEKDASKLTDDVKTIEDYVKVLDELKVTEDERTTALGALAGYSAAYYTYTFYDSADFVPFNKTTAGEGQTGYDYKASDYSETLAYFSIFDQNANSRNIFVDYSAIDQNITLNEADDGSSDNNETENNTANTGSNWLLITSIIFAIVMLFALAAVLVRYLWKKIGAKRRQRSLQQNNYKQRQRAMRKYRIAPEESGAEPESDTESKGETVTPAEDASENAKEPAEETLNKETPDEKSGETPSGDGKKDE